MSNCALSFATVLFLAIAPLASAQVGQDGTDNSFMAAMGRQATLDFSFEPDTDLDAGGSFSYWDARISAPVYGARLTDDWTLGVRMRYRASVFDWNQQVLFDNDTLHRIDLNVAFIYKPRESPWMGFISAGPALATDGSNIDGDDIFVVALGGVGYRFSDTFTLLGGAYFPRTSANPDCFLHLASCGHPTMNGLSVSFLRVFASPTHRTETGASQLKLSRMGADGASPPGPDRTPFSIAVGPAWD